MTPKSGSSKSSDKKSKSSKKSSIAEVLASVTPVPIGTEPSTLPFPEWVDQEVNAEKWDVGKAKSKPMKPVSKKSSPIMNEGFPDANFIDPQLIHFPFCIPVYDWKRPSEVFPDASLVMYKESSEYPDLLSGNKHLLHSEFMRAFISAVGILEYLGYASPWPMEGVNSTFTPTTADEPWKPWHHIYSMCKAGKGQTHNPQVNQLGKYVIRLYWLGCWRKIIIDDRLPVDEMNHVLLPTAEVIKEETKPDTDLTAVDVSQITEELIVQGAKDKTKNKGTASSGSDKTKKTKKDNEVAIRTIELWPFILSKALLKVASLTWTETNELIDFDIINSLTGWIVQKVSTKSLNCLDIWEMCTAYTDHYAWPESEYFQSNSAPSKRNSKTSGTTTKKTTSDKSSSKNVKGSNKGSKKGKKGAIVSDPAKLLPYCLVGQFSNMRDVKEDDVIDVSPCWSHHFLIDQTRNIPLIKPEIRQDLARWKRFRWIAWATRNGTYHEIDNYNLIKCFKLISNFRKCSEHVIYQKPSVHSMDIKKSVEVIDELAEKMGDKKGKKGKDKGGKDKGSASDKSSKTSKKSDKSSKEKGKIGKGKSKVPLTPPPDPSIWSDFNTLHGYIDSLLIFLKPSQFVTKISMSDLAHVNKEVKGGKSEKASKKGSSVSAAAPVEKQIVWPKDIFQSRNEPFYMFMDSIDYKYVVINLNQAGNTQRLQISQDPNANVDQLYINDNRTISHIVLENYNWQKNEVGDLSVSLNTYGSKSILIHLKPGRTVLRLWIKSETSFVINILSDVAITSGTIESVIENMQQESQLLTKMCYAVGANYGKLVQAFGMPTYKEALLNFYSSYKPDMDITKKQVSVIHEEFMNEFINILKDKYPTEIDNIVFALKVLFLNPKLSARTCIQSFPETSSEEMFSTDNIELLKRQERASILIQSLFKKHYVRKIQSYHSQENAKYIKIFEILKKIYKEVLSIENRLITCPTIIRNLMFSNKNMQQIRKEYSLYEDLQSVIHFQHYMGSISPTSGNWIPIVRYVFYVNSPHSEIVKIFLFTDISKYVIRVFNNDTNKETQCFTNTPSAAEYSNNAAGYTIFCYGWSDDTPKRFTWKLILASLKKNTNSLIIFPEKTLTRDILCYNYKPYVNKQICKCLVLVEKDASASFRLSTSLENVNLYLCCINNSKTVCEEISGTGNVILPLVNLNYMPKQEEIKVTQSESKMSSRKQSKVSKGSKSVLSLKRKSKKSDAQSNNSNKSSDSNPVSSGQLYNNLDTMKNTFVIEGYVLNDSWPLDPNEWKVVETLKTRNLIASEKDMNIVTFSDQEISKEARFSAVKRSSEFLRKSLNRKSSVELPKLSKPYWCLQTIFDKGDSITVTRDKRREEQIKRIKRRWYEKDPGRYEKSRDLRNEYLVSHYIKPEALTNPTSSSWSGNISNDSIEKKETSTDTDTSKLNSSSQDRYTSNSNKTAFSESIRIDVSTPVSLPPEMQIIDADARSLSRPIPHDKRLPPLDLEIYMNKENISDVSNDERRVKTVEDEHHTERLIAEAIDDFIYRQTRYKEDMELLLADQFERNAAVGRWYQDCRKTSGTMMKQAYQLRENYIDSLIEAEKIKQGKILADKKGEGKGKTDSKKPKKPKK